MNKIIFKATHPRKTEAYASQDFPSLAAFFSSFDPSDYAVELVTGEEEIIRLMAIETQMQNIRTALLQAMENEQMLEPKELLKIMDKREQTHPQNGIDIGENSTYQFLFEGKNKEYDRLYQDYIQDPEE